MVAVDNIGFGKSDKPDLDYPHQTHYKFIDGFIRALDLEILVLVVRDWGSVIGLDYARQNEGNVLAWCSWKPLFRLVFQCPISRHWVAQKASLRNSARRTSAKNC